MYSMWCMLFNNFSSYTRCIFYWINLSISSPWWVTEIDLVNISSAVQHSTGWKIESVLEEEIKKTILTKHNITEPTQTEVSVEVCDALDVFSDASVPWWGCNISCYNLMLNIIFPIYFVNSSENKMFYWVVKIDIFLGVQCLKFLDQDKH